MDGEQKTLLSRRSFFGLGAAALVAATTNPTYFFAPAGGWHSGVIINPGTDIGNISYMKYLIDSQDPDAIKEVILRWKSAEGWTRNVDGSLWERGRA
jgi:hypothetical protein